MKNKKRITFEVKETSAKHPILVAVFLAIATILLGLFFMYYSAKYDPISRQEAFAFSGEFERYEVSNYSKHDNVLYFKDSNYFYIDTYCNKILKKSSIDSLEQGAVLDILVNPNNNKVIEIKYNSEELLNFEEAQKAIDNENDAFFVLGIIAIVAGIGLFVITIIECVSKKADLKSKQSKLSSLQNDTHVARRADFSVKHKVLLDAKVDGYEICYRRVKSVNELVVNGYVYDEKKGIIEFTHTLVAVVDGHKIEAGLDEDSYSFISFDDELVNYKRRLI